MCLFVCVCEHHRRNMAIFKWQRDDKWEIRLSHTHLWAHGYGRCACDKRYRKIRLNSTLFIGKTIYSSENQQYKWLQERWAHEQQQQKKCPPIFQKCSLALALCAFFPFFYTAFLCSSRWQRTKKKRNINRWIERSNGTTATEKNVPRNGRSIFLHTAANISMDNTDRERYGTNYWDKKRVQPKWKIQLKWPMPASSLVAGFFVALCARQCSRGSKIESR